MSDYHLKFVPVPPPEEAPLHPTADALGLCLGLEAHKAEQPFRCNACHKMTAKGSWMVWVPDCVRRGDPAWAVSDAARRNAFNGSFSAWCYDCAPKAEQPGPIFPPASADNDKPKVPAGIAAWQQAAIGCFVVLMFVVAYMVVSL